MGGSTILLVAAVVVAACGGGGVQSDGEVGGHCYPNGTCNVGLSCSAGICFPADASEFNPDAMDSALDAAIDSALDAAIDAAPLVCNDDSTLEPNNTLQMAHDTMVGGSQSSFTNNTLAICPSNDQDFYLVTIGSANTNLEALVTYTSGAVPYVAITNTAGSALVTGAFPMTPFTVTFTTTPVGGTYAPQNCAVAWIEDSAGTFVRTIGRWCNTRKGNLVAWTGKAGSNDVDAVSGATRQNHAAMLTASWDLRGRLGNLVPDGQYAIRMETTDSNATMVSDNHQASFFFTKGPTSQVQTGLSNGGHTNVTINYRASATLRAYAANLPAGMFYVVVKGQGSVLAETNYGLTINVTQ